MVTRLVCMLSALALAGCHTQHYVMLDEAPLYADARGDAVLATLPRYHHEALEDAPEQVAGRLSLSYKGQRGYVPQSAVRLFRYLDPEWDGGDERRTAIQEALRDAQVRTAGRGWSPAVQDAVRRGEVRAGMTRQQVELAWGWPSTVEPDPASGGQRWIYRSQRTETLHRFLSDPFSYPSASLYVPGLRGYGCADFRDRYDAWGGWPRSGWIELRLEVTEERAVVIGADGIVLGVRTRRYLNDA